MIILKLQQLTLQIPHIQEKPLGLAPEYNPNFHVPFALVGFTTVVIVVSVFLIALGMWNLNPGKDSIIYRMTSQRKKDQ